MDNYSIASAGGNVILDSRLFSYKEPAMNIRSSHVKLAKIAREVFTDFRGGDGLVRLNQLAITDRDYTTEEC